MIWMIRKCIKVIIRDPLKNIHIPFLSVRVIYSAGLKLQDPG